MFGSHLSIAGGMHHAVSAATALGMGTVQVFTKNQQQWRTPALLPPTVASWGEACTNAGFEHTVAHDSYLINLASPDDVLWQKSIDAFVEELSRCDALGIPYLVTHPGAHLGSGESEGLRRVAAGLDAVHAKLPRVKVLTCLESTAGQGTSLGYRLEHLAEIMSLVKSRKRLAVCLDTAHLLAAGYDYRGRKFRAFMRELDTVVGVGHVRVLHLNDSKKDLGSRVDRHEHIGKGFVGLDGFKGFVREPAFRQIPKILETPKGADADGRDHDAVNLAALRKLMK